MTSRSGSDIIPCYKIDKPLVFTDLAMLRNDLYYNVAKKWQNLDILTPKCDFKVILCHVMNRI